MSSNADFATAPRAPQRTPGGADAPGAAEFALYARQAAGRLQLCLVRTATGDCFDLSGRAELLQPGRAGATPYHCLGLDLLDWRSLPALTLPAAVARAMRQGVPAIVGKAGSRALLRPELYPEHWRRVADYADGRLSVAPDAARLPGFATRLGPYLAGRMGCGDSLDWLLSDYRQELDRGAPDLLSFSPADAGDADFYANLTPDTVRLLRQRDPAKRGPDTLAAWIARNDRLLFATLSLRMAARPLRGAGREPAVWPALSLPDGRAAPDLTGEPLALPAFLAAARTLRMRDDLGGLAPQSVKLGHLTLEGYCYRARLADRAGQDWFAICQGRCDLDARQIAEFIAGLSAQTLVTLLFNQGAVVLDAAGSLAFRTYPHDYDAPRISRFQPLSDGGMRVFPRYRLPTSSILTALAAARPGNPYLGKLLELNHQDMQLEDGCDTADWRARKSRLYARLDALRRVADLDIAGALAAQLSRYVERGLGVGWRDAATGIGFPAALPAPAASEA